MYYHRFPPTFGGGRKYGFVGMTICTSMAANTCNTHPSGVATWVGPQDICVNGAVKLLRRSRWFLHEWATNTHGNTSMSGTVHVRAPASDRCSPMANRPRPTVRGPLYYPIILILFQSINFTNIKMAPVIEKYTSFFSKHERCAKFQIQHTLSRLNQLFCVWNRLAQ